MFLEISKLKMMKRKRGQIIGMPFVFIMIAIMMALVLYFGFNSLSDFFQAKDVTQVSKFVLDFENDVEVVYNYDVGSAKKFKSIGLPNAVTHVCFYDKSQGLPVTKSEIDELEVIDSELYYYLDVAGNDNLFLLPIGLYSAPYPDYYIEHLKLKPGTKNPLCFENNKKQFEIILESYLDEKKVYVGVREN